MSFLAAKHYSAVYKRTRASAEVLGTERILPLIKGWMDGMVRDSSSELGAPSAQYSAAVIDAMTDILIERGVGLDLVR